MPSPIQAAGGIAEPSQYAPLHTNRFMTGIWTNRNPLRDAATTFLYEKFYSATRFDSILGGVNGELTPKMSLKRRAGTSIYNTSTFEDVNRFYSFRMFSTNSENIRVIVDEATGVFDGTGPSGKVNIWTKLAGAGDSTFVGVGNNLYFGDGVSQKKWNGTTTADWGFAGPSTAPSLAPSLNNRYWQPLTNLGLNYTIVDPNGNVEWINGSPGPGSATGTTEPVWPATIGSGVLDGGFQWQNQGPPLSWLADFVFPFVCCILDSNGNLQIPQAMVSPRQTGATAPVWATALGVTTVDGDVTWVNLGPGTVLKAGSYLYAYSYHSLDGQVSTASPTVRMPSDIGAAGQFGNVLGGFISNDSQIDAIWIWRTAEGGSTLLFDASIPNTSGGTPGFWSYLDENPDSALNELLPAPIASSNNPPPSGFKPLAYHESRIWGAVGNTLSWSNGSNQAGDPNQSFSPLNFFITQAKIINAWASPVGLIVFTVSDIYIVTGDGTDGNPFTMKIYVPGIGLLSYDALTINLTTPYLMNSTRQVLALDPSSGIIEPGFPLADQFDANYDASTARLAWHQGSHGDTALYVGDAVNSWYRMAALSAPEQGLVWSPKGTLSTGYQAMQSVEVTPGNKQLLFGPSGSGPLLFRDTTVNRDVGVAFAWNTIIGSIVLAQPGQIAELSFITLESQKVGSRATVGVLLGEIDGETLGGFENLFRTRQDPPLLPPARTLHNDRYAFMQNQNPVLCRHLQINFSWPAEDAPNELLTYTLFGAIQNEMRSQ